MKIAISERWRVGGLLFALLLVSCVQATATPKAEEEVAMFAKFERELEHLRQQLEIPGFSAAVVKDQELIWAKGLRYADLKNEIQANTDNLSRPYTLGAGGLLNSTLALAFYKRFLFEPRYGQAVPDVDWQAGQRGVTQLLSQYADDGLRDLLAREYTSYKMSFDSYARMELLG